MAGDSLVERWGVNWDAPNGQTHERMPDGYWTPWHIASDRIAALEAENKALFAFVDGLARNQRKVATWLQTREAAADLIAALGETP